MARSRPTPHSRRQCTGSWCSGVGSSQNSGRGDDRQGEKKLGTVDDIMLDKVSGKAIYAIMSFGGFLGIGEKYHPLPWSTLKYDESKGGYVVNLDKRILENAPTYDMNEDFRWTPDYGPTGRQIL